MSTLGRKFSKRFERFGDSEAARKLRMASPSRKYHFASGAGNNSSAELDSNSPNLDPYASKKRVSRVASFRNFFMLTSTHAISPASTSLKTVRAVKRRANRSAGSVASGKT